METLDIHNSTEKKSSYIKDSKLLRQDNLEWYMNGPNWNIEIPQSSKGVHDL
jgi:hypothetical protein